MHKQFFLESLRGRDHSRRPRRRWDDNIKTDLMEIVYGVWVGFIWLRIV
jgi:hypothetical protein